MTQSTAPEGAAAGVPGDKSAGWPPPERRMVGLAALEDLLLQVLDEEEARLAAESAA